MSLGFLSAPPRRRDPRRALFCAAPEEIAPGVTLLRGGPERTMNVFLIAAPEGGVVVYDTGEQAMAPAILAAAAQRGGIRQVVLGHADTDHRGAAPALRRAGSGAFPITCHPDAVPHAQGRGGRDYWKTQELPLAVRVFHAAMHHVWDGGPVSIDGTLREGDEIAGFTVIELAGHAPGLIGLWRAEDRLALVSDTVYMTDMFGKPQPAAVPIDAYNHDPAAARESVRKLADLGPLTVWPGHLGPLSGDDVAATLHAAAER
jgi:hydroxyacylglutathione hydrolase